MIPKVKEVSLTVPLQEDMISTQKILTNKVNEEKSVHVVEKLTHDMKRGEREKKSWAITVSHPQRDADRLKIKPMMMEEENIFVT